MKKTLLLSIIIISFQNLRCALNTPKNDQEFIGQLFN